MVTIKANLIKGQYTQVTPGGKPILLQSTGDEVRIAFSDAQPVAGNPVFHLISGRKTLFFEYTDTAVWAMPVTSSAGLIATEGADRDDLSEIEDRLTALEAGGSLTTGSGLVIVGNEIRYDFVNLPGVC